MVSLVFLAKLKGVKTLIVCYGPSLAKRLAIDFAFKRFSHWASVDPRIQSSMENRTFAYIASAPPKAALAAVGTRLLILYALPLTPLGASVSAFTLFFRVWDLTNLVVGYNSVPLDCTASYVRDAAVDGPLWKRILLRFMFNSEIETLTGSGLLTREVALRRAVDSEGYVTQFCAIQRYFLHCITWGLISDPNIIPPHVKDTMDSYWLHTRMRVLYEHFMHRLTPSLMFDPYKNPEYMAHPSVITLLTQKQQ